MTILHSAGAREPDDSETAALKRAWTDTLRIDHPQQIADNQAVRSSAEDLTESRKP